MATTPSPRPLDSVLSAMPDPEDVRRRLAENLAERQALRRILKLSREAQSLRHKGPPLPRGDAA